MSYHLFLDDERHPKNVKWVELPLVNWVVVRSYEEFVAHITTNGLPKFISFDHDLSDISYAYGAQSRYQKYDYNECKELTGYHCAKWLIEYCMDNVLPPPDYIVHSMNPAGKENITSLLESFKKVHTFCPGCKNLVDYEVCHCGWLKKNHDPMELGHNFVPNGCDCGRA